MDENKIIKVGYGSREVASLANVRITKEEERAKGAEEGLRQEIDNIKIDIEPCTYEEALNILENND